MEIAVVGLSYKEANVQIRGKVSFTSSTKEHATMELKAAGLVEFMILSTCNRSEIYVATNHMHRDIDAIKSYYVRLAGDGILQVLYVKKYEQALQHLFQVATGLHSMIVGEDEILSQLKLALEVGLEMESCKKYLTKVVREAVTFSKKIKTIYKISENQLSVASIGVKYLKEHYGELKDKKILLIGTGEMGQLIMKYLVSEGITTIYITNRTCHVEQKASLQEGVIIHWITYADRYQILEDMDIVISATASPHTVLKASEIKPLTKPIVFVDMAVPRDLDEAIFQLPRVTVVCLDNFNRIAEKHLHLRYDVALLIQDKIMEEVKQIELWLLRTKIDRVILQLKEKQKRATLETLDQIKKTLCMTTDEEKVVEEAIHRGVWSIIKEPIQQLKRLEDSGEIDAYKMVIETLFDFDKGDES
jgi:glutamyl-tRNA reductase